MRREDTAGDAESTTAAQTVDGADTGQCNQREEEVEPGEDSDSRRVALGRLREPKRRRCQGEEGRRVGGGRGGVREGDRRGQCRAHSRATTSAQPSVALHLSVLWTVGVVIATSAALTSQHHLRALQCRAALLSQLHHPITRAPLTRISVSIGEPSASPPPPTLLLPTRCPSSHALHTSPLLCVALAPLLPLQPRVNHPRLSRGWRWRTPQWTARAAVEMGAEAQLGMARWTPRVC